MIGLFGDLKAVPFPGRMSFVGTSLLGDAVREQLGVGFRSTAFGGRRCGRCTFRFGSRTRWTFDRGFVLVLAFMSALPSLGRHVPMQRSHTK